MQPDDRKTEELGTQRAPRTRAAETPFLSAGARLRDRRYVLERLLGRGGMAAVWLGRDERLDRPVAIKVLSDTLVGDQGYLARFEREARVAAGLSHPHLVRIFDYGAERGRPFLVMEHVGGGDLGERLAAGRPPDPEHLARELLGALRYIHAGGVLHRDVKPQNVLLDRDGHARLTDFGIAQPRDATSLTQTGLVLGTVRYLAPEVLDGEAPSERSDLYSLGIVLAEVNEARPGGSTLLDLIEALRSPDPGGRPESAAAALRDLEAPAGSTGGPAAPAAAGPVAPHARQPTEARGERDRRIRLSRPLALGALAATVLAVLAVSVLGGGGGDPEPSQSGTQGVGEGQAPAARDAGEVEDPEGEPGPPAPAEGFALNEQGFALINQGRHEEAIPILERAVEALEGSGEITYAYALFNLGNALRRAGRAEEAIPILEARLEIPDQTEVVRRELQRARQDAGRDD